jgi:cell division protein FtsW (lipid II flippase)
LVSYGGSSIIAFMISLGIVFNLIERQQPELKLRIK